MQPVDSGFLHAGGKRLEYQWFGPGPEAAPTLVLLHEGLGCISLWRDFPQQLAERSGCGVLLYSRAGYGGSDPVDLPRPLRYMHVEGVEVLPEVLDAANVREAVLIGHSDGASIAIINAGAVHDPRVRAIALMAPHVFNEQVCVDSIRQAREAYLSTDLREKLARHHGDNVDCAFWGWNEAWLDPDFRDWNIEEFLPHVKTPVLLMQGRQDEYGTAIQLEAIERQVAGPVRALWLDDCRHSPHRDQPEATVQALTAFAHEILQPPAAASGGR